MGIGQPATPNPAAAASDALTLGQGTEQQINQPVATANQAGSNYNEFGPYGSLQFTQIGTGPGGVPIYGSQTSLSPQQQNLLNILQKTQSGAGGSASALLTDAGYGAATPSDVIGNLSSGLTGQNMQAYLASADPFFQLQTQQLDTQLRNQGLQPGNPAYDNAMMQLTTNQGYSTYGAAASFEPQAFSQATTEYELPATLGTQLAQFGAPANPVSTLEGGSALNIQTPNVSQDFGSEVTAANNQYAAQQAQYNAMVSGLMGVGGGVLGALV